MPNFTDLAGLASVASAAAAAVLLLPGIARSSTWPVLSKAEGLGEGVSGSRQAVLMGIVFVLMLIPYGKLPLAAYLRGMSGDLSITTQVLLWSVVLTPWFGNDRDIRKGRRKLLFLVASAGLLLYPLALGLGAFDPYRLGYGDPLFVAALLLIALAAWMWKQYLIALCIAFSILGWTIGWYESDNLWDFLLDPWAAIYALFALVSHGLRMISRGEQ